MVVWPSGVKCLGQDTKNSGPMLQGSPAEASFLRRQPPRNLSTEQSPGYPESGGEGWCFRGRKWWESNPWVLVQAHSTGVHSPGSWLSLRLWLQFAPESGMKCCRPVDIFCNYNLTIGAYWKWKSKRESHAVLSDSLWPHGLKPTRLLCPWNSPSQNTGVGSLSFLQGIFPTQGSNPVSRIAGGFFTSWATREAQEYWSA